MAVSKQSKIKKVVKTNKPVAKKPVAKAKVAPKAKAVAKKPVAKKPVAKKPVAKKPVAKAKVAPKAKAVVKKPVAKAKVAPKAKVVAKVAPKAKVVAKAKTPIVKKTIAPAPVNVVKPVVEVVEEEVPVVVLDQRAIRRTETRNAQKAKGKGFGKDGYVEIDTKKAVAFAMSIAEEMKLRAKSEDEKRNESEIRLTRRPTSRGKSEKTVQFPKSDLEEFRKRLLAARANALNGVSAMKATGFNETDDREADGGDGTNQTLRLQALGQMGNINRTIQQIEEALHRIDDGTYGVCTVCGQLIRKPRLLNQPFVLTCMECQSEMERNRN